jgi:hypothetical protein
MLPNCASKIRLELPLRLCVVLLANALLLVTHPDVQAGEATELKPQTVLGIQGPRFTLNGQPTFLLGISYFGGLGAPEEFVRRDLEDIQHHGFNWLRLWATWSAFGRDVSAVDSQGAAREPFLGKLEWLVAECDRRGLIVDVTLTRNQVSSKTANSAGLADFHSHQRAVETLISALKKYRNWYLDLANEHDVHDARYVSPPELKELRAVAYRIDPQLLVTASSGGHDLTEDDVHDSLITIGNDFLTPHRPREAKSSSQTEAQTRASHALMKAAQRVAPVHYQEPFRRGYNRWEPTADDFLNDLRGAAAGGRPVGVSTTDPIGVRRTVSLVARSTSMPNGSSTNSIQKNGRSSSA